MVNHQLATQVGFFLIAFDKKLLGACVKFPIDVAGGLAFVLEAVFGKFHTEPVEGTLVHAGDEALYSLFGQELQTAQLPHVLPIDGCHRTKIPVPPVLPIEKDVKPKPTIPILEA